MQIKRLHAPDMRQAIQMVRDELGADAVILSSRTVSDGVEVSAAAENETDALFAAPSQAAVHQNQTQTDASSRESLGAVKAELHNLRSLLENQLSVLAFGEFGRRHPGRAAILKQLEGIGLSASVARDLSASIPDGVEFHDGWQHVLDLLGRKVKTTGSHLLDEGGVIALLGPTGVGKTTTIAKIAARFTLRHGASHIALITTDSYRVGAHEQLRSFGRLMDIPVRVANDQDELREAVDFFRDRRLVLIDTAGMSQRDMRLSQQVSLLRAGAPFMQIFLVLSATSQWLSLEETVRAFGGVAADGCVITKTDECTSLGAALSVIVRHRLAVAFISNGQRVPEDLAVARGPQLVSEAVELAGREKEQLRRLGEFYDLGVSNDGRS